MKPQTTLLAIALLCCIAFTTQAQKDSVKAFLLSHNDQLVIGAYAGHNLTFPAPFKYSLNSESSIGPARPMDGYAYYFTLKYKLPQKFFFSTGITYQKQNYALSQYGGYDSPLLSPNPPSYGTFNSDYYICNYSNYYIGVPLSIGYFSTKKKLTYYASIGVEFYYNYKYNLTLYDNSKDITLNNNTYYPYKLYPGWVWSNFYNPYNWSVFNAFGMLDFGQSYLITPKISISYEAILRFINPLTPADNPPTYFAVPHYTAASFSLNLGLTYSFDLDNTGSFLLPDKEKNSKKHMAGFQILPNFITYIPHSTLTVGINFNYMFNMQFNLTNRIALETGISIDNFNGSVIGSYLGLGVPLTLKYYFPKENKPVYFIGAGVHMDWPGSFDNVWARYKYKFNWIRPIALIENGWDFKLGNNYVLSIAFGLERWLTPINVPGGIPIYDWNLPVVLFGSIGMSYSF